MPPRDSRKKDPAAVALGRKGGKKGGPARAAKLTPQQRRESARKAVQARWSKANQEAARATSDKATSSAADTSDNRVLALLDRIKAATSQAEVRQLTNELERAIFHKQYSRL